MDTTTLESVEISHHPRRSRWSGGLGAVVAIILVAAVAVAIWIINDDGGPVPADQARIEFTFTGDGTSFLGDREIIEGTVTVEFSNKTDDRAVVAVLEYQTGSAALASELEVIEEGGMVVTSDPPTAGFEWVEAEGMNDLGPGGHTWTMDLEAGNTYLIDVGPEGFHTKGLWRAAVIEVVAD